MDVEKATAELRLLRSPIPAEVNAIFQCVSKTSHQADCLACQRVQVFDAHQCVLPMRYRIASLEQDYIDKSCATCKRVDRNTANQTDVYKYIEV